MINICTMSDVHTVHCPVSTLSHVPGPLSIALWPACPLQVAAHASLLEFSLSVRINHIALDTCPKSCQFMALGRLARSGACTCATAGQVKGSFYLIFCLVLHATLRRSVSASSVLNVPKISSDFNCSLSSVSAGKFDCVCECVCGPHAIVSESW